MTPSNIRWFRVPVDKAVMKQLQKRSDLRGMLQAGSQLAIVCLTGWLCYYAFHQFPWPIMLPLLFLHGTFFGFLTPGAAIHELSHGTPFETKALNEFFYKLFCFLTWTNPILFRQSHMQHHQNTLHDILDQEVILPQILGWKDFFYAFTFSPKGIYSKLKETINLACGKLSTDWQHRLFDNEPRKRNMLFREARILLLGQSCLITLFALSGNWILILIISLPFYGHWLNFLCGGTQHAGLQDNVPDFRRSCRTVRMNAFNRFWYWNMNYHVEHHMYAAIPFHALPQLHEAIRHDCPAPNDGLLHAWKEILQTGRRQRIEPEFYFDSFSRKETDTPETSYTDNISTENG